MANILIFLLNFIKIVHKMSKSSILNDIKRIAAPQKNVFQGVVLGVDLDKNSARVKDILSDVIYEGVRLTAIKDGQKDSTFVLIPKFNSAVTCLRVTEQDTCIIVYSELEKAFLFGNENEGLAKVVKLSEQYNKIENKINALIQALNSWTPVPQDGGAALKTALASFVASQLQLTNKNEIQNDKITH